MIDLLAILRQLIAPTTPCAECGAFLEPDMVEQHLAFHAAVRIVRAPGSMLHTHGEPRL